MALSMPILVVFGWPWEIAILEETSIFLTIFSHFSDDDEVVGFFFFFLFFLPIDILASKFELEVYKVAFSLLGIQSGPI